MPTLSDLRYAIRLLARSPLVTATAVLSIALGIAATAAIFSIADALLLRPRPGVRQADRLVDVGRARASGEGFDNFGYALFSELRRHSSSFEDLAASVLTPDAMSLGSESAERVHAALVSASYFGVLGTRAAVGRTFLDDEDRTPGERPVTVLSYGFWMRRFSGDPGIVGRTLVLNGLGYTVVGVAEAGFTGHSIFAPDLWVPMAMVASVRGDPDAARVLLESHNAVWHTAIGRLKPGVTTAEARAELNTIYANVAREHPAEYAERSWSIAVERSGRVPYGLLTPVLAFVGLLFGLTLVVLLIACSNVAGMLLARATVRRREMATRLAIGADRRRLIGQLLTETAALFALAAIASLPVTFAFVQGLEAAIPSLPVPLMLDLQVNWRVLVFAFSSAAATGLAFGLAPARQALRVDLAPALHGHGATADRQRLSLRQVLVTGQVALSLLLLVATGLFLRTLQQASTIPPGFDPAGVEVVTLDTALAGHRGQATVALVEGLLARVRALPGVEGAATSRMIPLQGGGLSLGGLRVPGTTSPGGDDVWSADWDVVSPEYFATLRLPVVEGRAFTADDRDGGPLVAIVNETFAARAWPGRSAVGQRLWQTRGRDRSQDRPVEVIGVARDGKYRSLGESPRNFVYVPLGQHPMTEVNLYVRLREARDVGDDLRALVREADPNLPVLQHVSLEEAIGIGLLPQRLAAAVSGAVGVVGLLLAAIGLYGVTAFAVAQRTREIAVRMALGATRARVLRLVFARGLWLTAAGLLVGLGLAAGTGSLARSLLVGVSPLDGVAFGAAAGLLTIVAALATWVPANRASRLDPARALRAE
ncbi:MAG: ABC transporter permease [Acidobacteriota bacterium]